MVNDHLLKGARVLPGVVTGKLSDFAGLVVAPVLAAALISARTPLRRGLAFAAVALPFAAIKLSAAAAGALTAAAAMVGLKFRIWQDPTDLVAFVMLVPAWRLSAASLAQSASLAARPASRAVWVAERAVMGASAVACVATSVPVGGYGTEAYIVNFGPRPVDVRVRWVDAKLDCASVMARDMSRLLGPNAFNLGVTYHLEAGATAPLNRVAAYLATGQDNPEGMPDDGTTATGGTCEVALVETDEIPATLVWWDGLEALSVPANANEQQTFWGDETLRRGQVLLVPASVVTPGEVKQARMQKTISAGTCKGVSQQSYQWSVWGLLETSSYFLDGAQVLPDGCLELSLSEDAPGGGGSGGAGGSGGVGGSGGQASSSGYTAYLCIPAEEFPFAKGAQLAFTTDATTLTIRDIVGTKKLQVVQQQNQLSTGGLIARTVMGLCDGDRLACGGYVVPAALEVQTGGQTTTLNPGESMSGPGFKLRVGRAELVPVGRDACDAGYQTPSMTADFLISFE